MISNTRERKFRMIRKNEDDRVDDGVWWVRRWFGLKKVAQSSKDDFDRVSQ